MLRNHFERPVDLQAVSWFPSLRGKVAITAWIHGVIAILAREDAWFHLI